MFQVEAPIPSYIPCPYCAGRTVCYGRRTRRVRHSYAWHLGVLWLEIQVPRQRCLTCAATFMYDFGLGLSGASTEAFRREIVHRCHGRSLSSVARESGIAYTTLERWFYVYALDELIEEEATVVSVDKFATRKGQQYATSVLNVLTGRILAIVPYRNEEAIAAALVQLKGTITTVVSDFAPAMAKAIRSVFLDATHILDRSYLVQFFTEAILPSLFRRK